MALLASYLEAAELELQVFLLVEQLLQTIGQDDVCVVEAAVLLVELVVLVVLHARRHTVVGHGSLVIASIDHGCRTGFVVHRSPISRKIERRLVIYMGEEKRSEK